MATPAEKMRIRPGARVLVVDAPADVLAAMGLPHDLTYVGSGEPADHVHLFATCAGGLRSSFAPLVRRLAHGGALWVSWPKGGRLGTDLALGRVIEIGYDAGLVESTCLRVDDTWAALRFTRPKPGTVYANRYGTLPGQRPPALARPGARAQGVSGEGVAARPATRSRTSRRGS